MADPQQSGVSADTANLYSTPTPNADQIAAVQQYVKGLQGGANSQDLIHSPWQAAARMAQAAIAGGAQNYLMNKLAPQVRQNQAVSTAGALNQMGGSSANPATSNVVPTPGITNMFNTQAVPYYNQTMSGIGS
jgi:hypothetical protein